MGGEMFDATQLLGSFLEGRSSAATPQRLNAAVQQESQGGLLGQVLSQLGGGTSGGGLGALFGNMTGGATTTGAPTQAGGAGGLLGGLANMAMQAIRSPAREVGQNNPVAVGGLGALAGTLLGGGRGALGGGMLAVLGSLAYSAFQNASANTPSASNAPAQPQYGSIGDMPGYQDPAEVQRKAALMFRAMVQAAKADGNLDQTEMERLASHLDGAEAKQFVEAEINRPVDIAALVQDVKTPQEAAEVYAASIMAIDVDTDAERTYLADLAAALKLPAAAVDQVHSTLKVGA
jgi:uncharacterized membrane protein YebE (DUF533 family)